MLREDLSDERLRCEIAFTSGALAALLYVARERGMTELELVDLTQLTLPALDQALIDWGAGEVTT